MNFKNCVCLFYLLFFFSCNGTPRQKNPVQQLTEKRDSMVNNPAGSLQDTVAIDFDAAVFYYPDSLELEKIKGIFTKMEFESSVHECFYQMRNARMVLKNFKPQIRIIELSKAQCLLFIKPDKSKIYIDLNSRKEICSLFFFNKRKDPVPVDMTNIDTELNFYFLK